MLNCDFQFQRADFDLQVKLQVGSGVTGILGPSGVGKSTLLKVIAGLLHPQLGSIRFAQQTFFDAQSHICVPSHQRHVGLVFQDALLFPHLNVRQNLRYGYQHLQPEQRRFELNQVVELLEIDALVDRPVRQLSGGEAQRVALGRALLYSPQLLLLDEPLSALDSRLKQQILPFLARIRDETGIPMIYVTHQPSELSYLQANVIEMKKGVIRNL